MIYTLGIQQVYKDGHLIDAEGYEYDGKRLRIARHGRPQAVTTGDLENILAHPDQHSLLGRLHKCHSELHRVRRHVRHTHRRRRRHRFFVQPLKFGVSFDDTDLFPKDPLPSPERIIGHVITNPKVNFSLMGRLVVNLRDKLFGWIYR